MKIFAMVSMGNSLEFTDQALRSFFEHTPLSAEDKFILLDNDNSLDPARVAAYRLELLKNPVPLGFAHNGNQMIRRALAEGADLYFLNNDLIFSKNWLTPLLIDEPSILSPLTNREARYAVTVANTDTSAVVGQFACKMTMELNDYTGHEASFALAAEAHGRHVTGYLDVATFPFCCVKLPLTIMNEIGLFDESFGAGGAEDYDYALRALLAGFKAKYAFQSYVLHFGGRSSWSSGEASDVTIARSVHFRDVFRKKWGEKVYNLIVDEIDTDITESAELREMILKRDLKSVIRSLLEGKPVQIKI